MRPAIFEHVGRGPSSGAPAPTPDQRVGWLSERVERLGALAKGLCQDPTLQLRLGGGRWAYAPALHAIMVPEQDLGLRGDTYEAGLVAHEVGHVRVTRYLDFIGSGRLARATAEALNALEDARSDAWMKRSFPGVTRWLDHVTEVAQDACPDEASPFDALCWAFASDGSDGFRREAEDYLADPTLRAIFQETRDARIRYVAEQPQVGDREEAIRASARRAFDIAASEILPRVLPLWSGGEESAGGEGDGARRPPPWIRLPPGVRWEPLSGPRVTRSRPNTKPRHSEVSPDLLVDELDAILARRRRCGWARNFTSGGRVELAAVMAREANPRSQREPFMRRVVPNRRSVAFELLIDLSGSMRDHKIEAAIAGARLLTEALRRLEIPLKVDGFQDVLIPVSGFDAPLDGHAGVLLEDLALEVSGDRPGGNNEPGFNDDGPCLLAAAEALLSHPCEDRVMVVISDGCPVGRVSTSDDLHEAIARIGRDGIHLIGLGLGEGTEHVASFYPHHIAAIPVDELGSRLAEVVKEALSNPPSVGAMSVGRFGR